MKTKEDVSKLGSEIMLFLKLRYLHPGPFLDVPARKVASSYKTVPIADLLVRCWRYGYHYMLITASIAWSKLNVNINATDRVKDNGFKTAQKLTSNYKQKPSLVNAYSSGFTFRLNNALCSF